jgi:hypothetical protein
MKADKARARRCAQRGSAMIGSPKRSLIQLVGESIAQTCSPMDKSSGSRSAYC